MYYRTLHSRYLHSFHNVFLYRSRDSLVSTVTRPRAGRPKKRVSISGRGKLCLLSKEFVPAVWPTQEYQKLTWGVKLMRREADRLPTSSFELRNGWNCTSNPPIGLNGMYRSKFTSSITIGGKNLGL